MTLQSRDYRFIFASTMAALTFVVGSLIWYFGYYDRGDPYVVLEPEMHYAEQIGPAAINIRRYFQITEDIVLRINREIVAEAGTDKVAAMTPKGPIFFTAESRKELETTHVPYHPGYYQNDRELSIPHNTKPGVYKIVNIVCWPANSFREKCKDLPDVYVTIKEYPK